MYEPNTYIVISTYLYFMQKPPVPLPLHTSSSLHSLHQRQSELQASHFLQHLPHGQFYGYSHPHQHLPLHQHRIHHHHNRNNHRTSTTGIPSTISRASASSSASARAKLSMSSSTPSLPFLSASPVIMPCNGYSGGVVDVDRNVMQRMMLGSPTALQTSSSTYSFLSPSSTAGVSRIISPPHAIILLQQVSQ